MKFVCNTPKYSLLNPYFPNVAFHLEEGNLCKTFHKFWHIRNITPLVTKSFPL